MRQLRSHFGQAQLSGSKLVTRRATEFLEAFRLLTLLSRTLVLGHLNDYGHRRQHVDASFKTLSFFLALGGEAELAIVTYGVAILATVAVEDVLSQLLVALTRLDHPVQPALLGAQSHREQAR